MKMNRAKLLSDRESRVETILLRQLAPKGYRIYPKMRLSDVVSKGRKALVQREFDYFCRAHLDFVVAKGHWPIFAVEFDGFHHETDPRTCERDVIKNRLCRDAGLPLLRISGPEIAQDEQSTLLDYIVQRHAAWHDEIDNIQNDIAELVRACGPRTTLEDLDVWLDPSFRFDVMYPYPGTAAVQDRLWRDYRMAWDGDDFERCRAATYTYHVQPFRTCEGERAGYHKCEMVPRVWTNGSACRESSLATVVSASIRLWLPVKTDVPPGTVPIVGPGAMPFERAMTLLSERARAIWEPQIPGAHVFDIAENYARHKGYRVIEQWARDNLARVRA
jgi:Protein of unknown function (DUF2726)